MPRLSRPPLSTGLETGKEPNHDPLWRQWYIGISGLFSTTNVVTTPVVGASPFTFINSSTSLMQVFVTGGTVSQVQWGRKNSAGTYVNITIATATGVAVTLSQGDQIIITYTVAPTLTVSPL